MYFSSLKLFEVLKFFQFLMLFENQFLDTSSNFGAPIDFGYAKWGSVSTSPLHGTYTFESPIDLLKLL